VTDSKLFAQHSGLTLAVTKSPLQGRSSKLFYPFWCEGCPLLDTKREWILKP